MYLFFSFCPYLFAIRSSHVDKLNVCTVFAVQLCETHVRIYTLNAWLAALTRAMRSPRKHSRAQLQYSMVSRFSFFSFFFLFVFVPFFRIFVFFSLEFFIRVIHLSSAHSTRCARYSYTHTHTHTAQCAHGLGIFLHLARALVPHARERQQECVRELCSLIRRITGNNNNHNAFNDKEKLNAHAVYRLGR